MKKLAPLVLLLACGAGDFDPVSKVNTVRVLASRVDKPYAKPGETVTLELLAADGRKDQSRPMRIFWFPLPCVNPANDVYYACFASLFSPPSGGAPPSGVPAIRPGVDLSPLLAQGPTFSFKLPEDIIEKHPPVPGAGDPYGLAIAFNIACAGHVELVEVDRQREGPQAVPLGCFDDKGQRLGADDFVFGFTRVYAYQTRTNQNPPISGASLEGIPIDPNTGITLARCTKDKKEDCEKKKLSVKVPDEAQEENPALSVGERREQVWASFFSTDGEFENTARLLFDATSGRVPESETGFSASKEAHEGTLWIVVHDNRGGTSWTQFPLRVQ